MAVRKRMNASREGRRMKGANAVHPSYFILHPSEGQASVWAMLALLVLVMVGAALLDAYQWASTRMWAYHAAEAAAERGVTAGADWMAFQGTGAWRLDAARARTETEDALRDELLARGVALSNAAWDIRIHPTSALVTETSWPPRGSLWGDPALPPGGWTTDRPSIGVYLELDAPTWLGGLAGIRSWARIHVFASSSLVR
jgi:hypothetical protein